MDTDCGGDELLDSLCDVKNLWSEFWDTDDWDSGCISQTALFYDEETALELEMTDEPVYECITCLESNSDNDVIYPSMFGGCVVPEPCSEAFTEENPQCALCGVSSGPL